MIQQEFCQILLSLLGRCDQDHNQGKVGQRVGLKGVNRARRMGLSRDVIDIILGFVPGSTLFGVYWKYRIFRYPNQGNFRGGGYSWDEEGHLWFETGYPATYEVWAWGLPPKQGRRCRRHGKLYKILHPKGRPKVLGEGTMWPSMVKPLVREEGFARMLRAFLEVANYPRANRG